MKLNLHSYLVIITAATMLAGCSDCHCPECPPRTTVVNPPPASSTTVIKPDSNY